MKTNGFVAVGADTDGLAFKKADEKPFTPEERKALVDELNSLMDPLIRWEDDGVVKKQIVVKTKNYILEKDKKDCKPGEDPVKIKGSALKATTKEKALQRFLREVIELLLKDRKDQIFPLYFKYAKEICNLTDITDWCSKKTVTKAVLESNRTNEQRVLDAIGDTAVQEGDKIYVFFRTPEELCLREKFDGTYDRDTLLEKLYNTLEIFALVIDTSLFPNFALKRNCALLGDIPDLGKAKPNKGTHFPTGFFQVRGN